MTKKESVIVLLSITLCWSSSYVFIKAVPEDLSVYAYLALTSGAAALLLSILSRKRFQALNRKTLWQGLVLGLLITGNMAFEKLGLDHLPASSVSALEALNIIIVPIILLLKRKFPTRNNLAGIAIIFIGIIITSYTSMEGGGLLGILFILGSCVMMSLYTILATEYTKENDPMLLTILQLIVTAVTGFILWTATDPESLGKIRWSQETISYIFILAFFSKAYAYTMLMYADRYADAISVTVIAALDPVVTLLMAVIIPVTGGAEIFSFRSPAPAPAPPEEEKNLLPEKKRRKILALSFIGIILMFTALGVSIDVMDMADGYTNLRPEHCLSVPAGLMLGPVGALACAFGNLIGDFFSDFDSVRVFGFIANFIMAYLPYKVWRVTSPGEYNVHTWKRILLYLWAAALGSLYCSCLLGICLAYFFHEYYEMIILQIFANNFGFSVCFGLPLFIVMRSDGQAGVIWSGTVPEMKRFLPRSVLRLYQTHPDRKRTVSRALLAADTAVIFLVFMIVVHTHRWWESPFVAVLSCLAAVLLLATCLFPADIGLKAEA